MSIPYYFDTPVPRYFRDNGYFSPSNKMYLKNLVFITWAFSKCSIHAHTVFHDAKNIHLAPFEFICGRMTCSEETGLTENEARHQLKLFTEIGFLTVTTNSIKNRYFCYQWRVDAFHQLKNKKPPTEPPTENELTQYREHENEKLITNSNTKKPPTEPPQSRSRTKNMDIDQGFSKNSKKDVKLNGEDIAFLEKENFSTIIAKQVVDAFNANPPHVKRSAKALIKVWANNTQKAYQLANSMDGSRFGNYEVSAFSKHVEFIAAGNCPPITITYTDENAAEKIKDTASRLAVVN